MKVSRSRLKSLLKVLGMDALIVLIGAVGAIFCAYLFIQDINATLQRQGEQPVGAIASRYNIVQRRFSNRLAWDRLNNNSPVYNGDIIRTDNLSEAIISFDHGDEISLFSNTLVQVFIDSQGNRIDFSSGDLIINTPVITSAQPVVENRRGLRRLFGNPENSESARRPERSMIINTGEQRVRVERGSAIRLASLDDGDMELTVNEGTITLEETPVEEPATQRRRRNRENSESAIFPESTEVSEGVERRRRTERTEGENTEIAENPERRRRTENTENPERTERSTRSENNEGTQNSERPRRERALVINTGEQRIRTERGSSIRVDSQDGEVAISVNEGTATLESTVTDETVSLETGRRARLNRPSRRDSDETSESEIAEIVIETFEPEPRERTRRERTVRDGETNRPERSERIERNTETTELRDQSAGSERTGSRQRELLPAPRNRIPDDQHTITAEMILDSRSLVFSWDSVRDATGYILTIFRDNEGFRSTVLQTEILTETSYTIENIRRYRGNLFWQVEAVRLSEDGSFEMRGRLRENALIVDIPRRENTPGSERTSIRGRPE